MRQVPCLWGASGGNVHDVVNEKFETCWVKFPSRGSCCQSCLERRWLDHQQTCVGLLENVPEDYLRSSPLKTKQLCTAGHGFDHTEVCKIPS